MANNVEPVETPESEALVPIESVADIVTARERGRALADHLGFGSTDCTLIATAISELARNIVLYARTGEIELHVVSRPRRCGIGIVARDRGPGIPDAQRALMGGYSTSNGLGLGLSGVRRIMDEFDVRTELGEGTTISATKWRPESGNGGG